MLKDLEDRNLQYKDKLWIDWIDLNWYFLSFLNIYLIGIN